MSDVPLITGTSSLDLLTEAGLSATAPITSTNRPFFWQQIERIRAALAICDTLAPIKLASVALTDAQIKALPTTPITLIAAPAAGKRIKVIGASIRVNASAGAYTNVNTTYADLRLDIGGSYVSAAISNDSSLTTDLTDLTTILGASDMVVDFLIPDQRSVESGGVSGTRAYVVAQKYFSSALNATALTLSADNNGSGNFTGGNAANSARCDVCYVVI